MWSVSVGLRWSGSGHSSSQGSRGKAGAAAAAAAAAGAARGALERAVVAAGGCGSGGGPSAPRVAAMLYYSLDPQFGALLYSVASRYERFSLLPDAFSCCAHGGYQAHSEVLAYAHALGLHLYTIGENYAYFLTQVRAGSVIFLVGVGSLVCWKLWEHWRSGHSPRSPTPSPPSSPPSRRARGLLASLLEEDLVQDLDDIEDEDPALIHGKYFGPESPCGDVPCEDLTPLSSEVSEVGEVPALHYHADASASISAGDVESSSGDDSLPTDEDSEIELFGGNKRVVRKKHRSHPHRNKVTSNHLSISNPSKITASPGNAAGKKQKAEAKQSSRTIPHPLQECWSSESSPGHQPLPHPRHAHDDHTRHLGDGSETPDSEDMVEKRRLQVSRSVPVPLHNRTGEECFNGNRLLPDGEEEGHGSGNFSSASLSDLMDKMRQRGYRPSISRENSIASNLSEIMSPSGAKRFPFTREDSVCSNLSDFAPSECSEMSLDVSVRDDLAGKTFTYLNDIEQEIDDLKYSMLEMDKEVTKFSSRPNPYTFKTTYSDYSITSGESRPNSALDIVSAHKSRANFRGLLAKHQGSSESEYVEGAANSGQVVSGSEAEGSFEWDSPQHGWSSMRPPPLSKLTELPTEDADSSRASGQEDMMPSLEWDNDCLQQYSEQQSHNACDNQLDEVFHNNPCETSFAELEGFEEYKMTCSRHQLLPDHSSLELDLEEELQSPSGPVTEASDLHNAAMTVSVDSAIHSATGSRSTSSSPVPSALGNSLLSSSGLASSSEISPATPDSEAGWGSWERKLGEFGHKARRCWSSEESGYMEGPDPTLDAHTHLSPVHEIKEKENTESSSSSPQHHSDLSTCTTINNTNNTVNNTSNNNKDVNLNDNLIMGNTTSNGNDNTVLGMNTQEFSTAQINMSVGQKVDIVKYAAMEWQGNTSKAQVIKQGYSAIPVELNYKHLRRVRGDNYCGIRATLYQILSHGLTLPNGHTAHSRLTAELNHGATWLKDWSFGQRLNFSRDQILNGFWECLDTLDSLVLSLMGCENRECVVLSRLNSDPLLDIKACEAVKLHMLAAALDLYQENNNGHSVPLFAMIMFARHTSLTPKDLVKNHLNLVGDSAGLEQDQHKIEMFLMGHTLGVTLQVVRPACYGKDDFICYYPDANIGVWPEVTLVAEDDRHYNVLVK